jgi:hypothetical protein
MLKLIIKKLHAANRKPAEFSIITAIGDNENAFWEIQEYYFMRSARFLSGMVSEKRIS